MILGLDLVRLRLLRLGYFFYFVYNLCYWMHGAFEYICIDICAL